MSALSEYREIIFVENNLFCLLWEKKLKKTTSDWHITRKRFFELGSSVGKFRDNRLVLIDVVKKQQGLTLGVLFENLRTKI